MAHGSQYTDSRLSRMFVPQGSQASAPHTQDPTRQNLNGRNKGKRGLKPRKSLRGSVFAGLSRLRRLPVPAAIQLLVGRAAVQVQMALLRNAQALADRGLGRASDQSHQCRGQCRLRERTYVRVCRRYGG